MIFFVRSYIAEFDGKLGKYFKALSSAGLPFRVIGWNKTGQEPKEVRDDVHFKYRARLGGGWRNAIALLRWNLFVFLELVKARRQVQIVHAVDLDTALISSIFCILFGRTLVFDIYDKYTAVRSIGGLAGHAIDCMERWVAKRAEMVIIASPARFSQHGLTAEDENVLVLENVPESEPTSFDLPKACRPWRIGYFGVLEPTNRGLEHLLTACEGRSDVELHVVGYGALVPLFASAAALGANIYYHGAQPSEIGLGIISTMDITVGMYYLSVPNHRYASPNKYYEHLMLGRPLLTTAGTPPGALVERNHTGWAIPEGLQSIHKWLDGLTPDDIRERGRLAHGVWERSYENYYAIWYQGEYVSRMKRLAA